MNKNPYVIKVLALIAIIGLLMLALGRISSLADERQGRFADAVRGIENAQSGRQAVLGPVLQTVCTEEWDTEDWTKVENKAPKLVKTVNKRDFRLVSTPVDLNIQSTLNMVPLYRGLFKVNTYAATTTLKASFSAEEPPKPEQKNGRLRCAAPTLMMAVTDGRGIRQAKMQIGETALTMLPGTGHDKYASGFHAVLPEKTTLQPFSALVTLELIGSTSLAVVPMGDNTEMTLAGNWPHPSFGGRFLPTKRNVTDTNFTASWQVSSLASTASREFLRDASLCESLNEEGGAGSYAVAHAESVSSPRGCLESFGVSLIDPVNPYSLSDRAVKYGLLFIALSFVAVGLVEVLRRLRVHPVQYLLVGSALSIFFLLLLSLSEHLSFTTSYLIASGACVSLLTFYGRHLLNGWKAGFSFGAAIAALYGGLFAVLQMEQTALVMGAVLLFVVLAAVMTLTRRVDWYQLTRGTPAPDTPAPPQA